MLIANLESIADPLTAFGTFERDEVRTAINTAFGAIKSHRIGTNLLEITTCGAVAPYNRMLGGKLVALLLLSPEVTADNRRRYGQRPTIIRSQLKNERVVPDNTLVWLGTTSLFAHGSSQYKRLAFPLASLRQTKQRFVTPTWAIPRDTVPFILQTTRCARSNA